MTREIYVTKYMKLTLSRYFSLSNNKGVNIYSCYVKFFLAIPILVGDHCVDSGSGRIEISNCWSVSLLVPLNIPTD